MSSRALRGICFPLIDKRQVLRYAQNDMVSGRRSVLIPKLVTSLQTYDRAQFTRDLTAGIIVGIVALPLAIAFAIASGVTPDRGLWTAIVAGFLISALGGSRVQIGGLIGAFVGIVYGIVPRHEIGRAHV